MSTDVDEIKKFLKNHVKTDSSNFEDELKQNFVLGKRKPRKKVNDKRTHKSKFMTRKEKKALGLYRLPIVGPKYEDALPMNSLWRDYARRQLGSAGESGRVRVPAPHEKAREDFSVAIYKSDLHGAVVSVEDSKCESLKGLKGLCIMETKNTFKLLTENNAVKTVPKVGSLFKIHYDDFDIMIYGKHITKRPAERSVKIPKAFSLSEL